MLNVPYRNHTFFWIEPFCWGKRKQATENQKRPLSHTVKELVANHLLDPEATARKAMSSRKKKKLFQFMQFCLWKNERKTTGTILEIMRAVLQQYLPLETNLYSRKWKILISCHTTCFLMLIEMQLSRQD